MVGGVDTWLLTLSHWIQRVLGNPSRVSISLTSLLLSHLLPTGDLEHSGVGTGPRSRLR